MDDGESPVGRRELLASAGVATASSLAGCTDWLWSHAEDTGPEQVSLTIKTVPADDDVVAAKILSQLRENVQAAGIAATHEPIAQAELYRDVLLAGEYDVFVCRHPGLDEYDAVRGLLHSRLVSERGWQNPFHFSEIATDDLLETQQAGESTRGETLQELFEHLESTAPYTVVAYPDLFGGRRQSLTVSRPPQSPIDYIDLIGAGSAAGTTDRPLDVGVFGEGLTQRLNPLVVDRNGIDGLLELLYDPLVRRRDDEVSPWLATSIDWIEDRGLGATVRLREGLTWHDGTGLDADDVAFTYRFLDDTSLGNIDGGVPAHRYRSRRTLVDTVDVEDSRTARFSFDTTARRVAARALSIPILPEHIWAERSAVVANRQPEALRTDNDEPIGSGLLRFSSSTTNSEIVLEPFDDHALLSADDRPESLDDGFQFDGLRFQVAPNPGAMVRLLVDGEIDITASNVPSDHAGAIRDSASVSAISGPTDSFYMIGYNTQHPQLGNPHFRRILSTLIDREHVATELFDGMAEPATAYSSLFGFPDPEWDQTEGRAIPEFPGTDGEISVPRVRSLFEAEGYRYEDNQLLE